MISDAPVGFRRQRSLGGFFVPEATKAQRIVRAKRRIRDNLIAYLIPETDQLSSRLGPVMAAIYLVFKEGHTATGGASLSRPELTSEALWLCRLLVELLRRLGRVDEARVAVSRAIAMATNEVELRHLKAQLDSLPD